MNVPYCYFPVNNKKLEVRTTCPKLHDEEKLDCHPEPGSTETQCLNRDCCWEPVQNNNFDVPYCFYKNMTALPPPPKPESSTCSKFHDVERMDCYPENGASESGCGNRGCCWAPPTGLTALNVPYCFYPRGYCGYNLLNITKTAYGLDAYLNRTFRSAYPRDVRVVKMVVKFEQENRLHIKISDAEKTRWEPPYPEVPMVDKMCASTAYSFVIDHTKVGFRVVRKSDYSVM